MPWQRIDPLKQGGKQKIKDNFILTPYFLDQPLPGLEGIIDEDWKINQPRLDGSNTQERLGVLYQPLTEFVNTTISRGERPISIAGDCCTSLGVLAGLQQAGIKPTLIWFDAHGDFNTWETTPSGFLGGMPLAMSVGRGEQTIPEAVGLDPIPETDVILTDARDLDPGEKEALAASQVTHMSNVEDLLNYPFTGKPLYVHFDTDVIDPREAPAMNYASPGGPTAKILKRVFHHLAQTGRIKALSLSSWNPSLDYDGRTKTVSMNLLQTLIDG